MGEIPSHSDVGNLYIAASHAVNTHLNIQHVKTGCVAPCNQHENKFMEAIVKVAYLKFR